jgi:O-methyltransferase
MTETTPQKVIHPAFLVRSFFGFADFDAALAAIQSLIGALKRPQGFYIGDNLMTFSKSLSFMDDQPFRAAWEKHSETIEERAALWRRATLIWAARTALRLEGDFVECGCYKGTGPRIIADVLDFGALDRRYYLYDLFEHNAAMPHHHMREHSGELFDWVRARFADLPNVVVTQGRVPDSLAIAAPEKIAFMHLDLNNADAEVGALEVLFDRIVPGGILILDDYGWLGYRDQLVAEKAWFKARGYEVLEMPTGQGMVIK